MLSLPEHVGGTQPVTKGVVAAARTRLTGHAGGGDPLSTPTDKRMRGTARLFRGTGQVRPQRRLASRRGLNELRTR